MKQNILATSLLCGGSVFNPYTVTALWYRLINFDLTKWYCKYILIHCIFYIFNEKFICVLEGNTIVWISSLEVLWFIHTAVNYKILFLIEDWNLYSKVTSIRRGIPILWICLFNSWHTRDKARWKFEHKMNFKLKHTNYRLKKNASSGNVHDNYRLEVVNL